MKIKEVTTLTNAEYEKFKTIIPLIEDWWWLRTPGHSSSQIRYVTTMMDAYYEEFVSNVHGVRPALICETIAEPGDVVAYGGYTWTVLTPTLLLCDKVVDFRRFDAVSNNWEFSELSGWLNSTFLRVITKRERKQREEKPV